jgi:hypothetical protein
LEWFSNKQKQESRRKKLICVLIVVLGIIVVFGTWLVWKQSGEGFFSVQTEIDLSRGDLRIRSYLADVRIGTEISETPFSKMLRKYQVQHEESEWEWIYTRGYFPKVHSSNYSLGDVLQTCDLLGRLLESKHIANEEKRLLLRDCLKHMRERKVQSMKTIAQKLLDRMETQKGKDGEGVL